jgi:hypothetical protein
VDHFRGSAAPAGYVGGPLDDGLGPEREKYAMNRDETTQEGGEEAQHQPHRVRLPGFLIEEETGLGDVIKLITYALGIKPCDGCEKRAAALNRWMRFSR